MEPLPDQWHERDLPVLRYVVQQIDDTLQRLPVEQVAAAVGLDVIDVKRAAQALDDAGLVKTDSVAESPWPLWFVGITREARERTGVWPTPESAVAGLTAAVDELLTRPGLRGDERTRLQKFRDGLLGLPRELAVEIGAAIITGRLPI